MFATTQRARPGSLPSVYRSLVQQSQRQISNEAPKSKGYEAPVDHGEKIWVFCHRRTDQIIYSFTERLSPFHALKQLPFNGKQSKPATIRKDYWSHLARIEFGSGQGNIGRSVYQKLRELKHLHEVAWEDDFLYKTPKELSDSDKKIMKRAERNGNEFRPMRNKKQRGAALNAQKLNSIADLAVILAGTGRGNLVAKTAKNELEADGTTTSQLHQVVVKWSNDQDKNFAESWSKNVKHSVLETPKYIAEPSAIEQVGEPATAPATASAA